MYLRRTIDNIHNLIFEEMVLENISSDSDNDPMNPS